LLPGRDHASKWASSDGSLRRAWFSIRRGWSLLNVTTPIDCDAEFEGELPEDGSPAQAFVSSDRPWGAHSA
jgi:hypothetical protein